MKKLLFACIIISFIPSAQADQVANLMELAQLPPYCKGTQQIREISKDPKSMRDYEAIYGEAFRHLHHYCWALNAENKVLRLRDTYLKESKLTHSLSDYKYFLERAPETFPLLADVYSSRARVLFALKRDAEAINDLKKAIQLQPEHPLAYARLSDYFVEKNDKNNAIKILEQGIDNSEQSASLIRRLEKLGKTYQGIPGNARKKEIPVDTPATDKTDIEPKNPGDAPDTSAPTTPPAQSIPDSRTEAEKKANPYCRFCP